MFHHHRRNPLSLRLVVRRFHFPFGSRFWSKNTLNTPTIEESRRSARESRSPFAVQSSPAACTAGAHEGRRLWRKQAVVSPMKQGVPQASLRAQWDDHAELRGAWTRNTPRRKIPFSRAKIASLQFPRPEIHRISAETGEGRTKAAACGGNRP